MEMQLQELISQIKKDGVEAAEAEAQSIVDAAKAEAEKIISEAQAQAQKLLLDAKNQNEKMVKSSEDAIRQAGRNLLISFRESVSNELKAIINENVSAVYASDAPA
jgi:V/A-type H+-transporting ATPase subunit E